MAVQKGAGAQMRVGRIRPERFSCRVVQDNPAVKEVEPVAGFGKRVIHMREVHGLK